FGLDFLPDFYPVLFKTLCAQRRQTDRANHDITTYLSGGFIPLRESITRLCTEPVIRERM
ncbi:MAG TPA: hypothetical protein VKA04_03105, partial [Pseudodesulfovibrio sp.]|nr:hypothetical protein [Pseudodesulfovibrio sp.]